MAEAETGAAEGLTIQALVQKKGRGRFGHDWTSPMGNLYLSVLLRPDCDLKTIGQLGFVVALALSDALLDWIDQEKHDLRLKWPNDILVDGRKLAGILLETGTDHDGAVFVVAGTGVNVFAALDGAVQLDALAGNRETGRLFVNGVRDRYLAALEKRYAMWQKEGFAPIRRDWLARAAGIGQKVKIRLPRETHEAVFLDIDADGALVTELDGARRVFHAGEVHFGA